MKAKECPCTGCGGQCICDKQCDDCVNIGCEWWYNLEVSNESMADA